jgi:hypothetical protein
MNRESYFKNLINKRINTINVINTFDTINTLDTIDTSTNLLVLGAYRLADGYEAFIYNFNKYFDSISFFPLFIYNNSTYTSEYYDKCLMNCINGTWNNNDHIINIININKRKTHIIFFHNFDYLLLNIRLFNLICKNKNFKLIMINWDPNTNLNVSREIINCFDMIYMSRFNLLNYNIKPLFTGYLKTKSYFYENNDYKCDVLFIGTTLYSDNVFLDQNIKREDILDEICKDSNINLHIYTSNSYIAKKYIKNNKGYISYNDAYKAFSNAIFTLNISPLSNILENGHYYYSERLPQILACGSIMISNNDYTGLLEPNIDYIYLTELKNLNSTIIYYKNNPELIEKIKINYSGKIHLFNYDNIIDKLIIDIKII